MTWVPTVSRCYRILHPAQCTWPELVCFISEQRTMSSCQTITLCTSASQFWAMTRITTKSSCMRMPKLVPGCRSRASKALRKCQDHNSELVFSNDRHLILYFMQWISAKKMFRFGWKAIFIWLFKNLKILFSCGPPAPLITASRCWELWCRFSNVWLQAWLISLVLPL